MTLTLPPGDEPSEWYASCTEAVWVAHMSQPVSCNWYGEYRSSPGEAKTDAARHRRAHRDIYASPVGTR